MAKFKNEDQEIEAINWDGNKVSEFPEWLKEPWNDGRVMRMGKYVHISNWGDDCKTADPGDWIIREESGELHPCKPDVFEKTYTPATN